MRFKLRAELTLAFVALAVVPLVALGAFSIWQSSRTVHAEELNAHLAVAELAAAETEVVLLTLEDSLALLVGTADLAQATPAEIQLLLNRVILQSDEF